MFQKLEIVNNKVIIFRIVFSLYLSGNVAYMPRSKLWTLTFTEPEDQPSQ